MVNLEIIIQVWTMKALAHTYVAYKVNMLQLEFYNNYNYLMKNSVYRIVETLLLPSGFVDVNIKKFISI